MKASLFFYPNRAKIRKKTGKTPVYLRTYLNGKKAEIRLNVDLTEAQFLYWDPVLMRVSEKKSLINQYLNNIELKFQEFLAANGHRLPALNASYIRDSILGYSKDVQTSVLKFVEKYYTEAVINNINRTPGTIKNYRRSINHFKKFLADRKQENLSFQHLTFEVAQDFKNYLVSSDPAKGRIGMTEVSASGVIKKFRTIFADAAEKNLLQMNPFKKIKIRTKSPAKERLTIEQVWKIYNLDLGDYPGSEVYRDIFLFCVYTGLAYRDVMNLSRANLEFREDGEIKMTVRRLKSEVLTECFLPDPAKSTIHKYSISGEEISGAKLLPQRSNQKLNSQLKLISNLANISLKPTTHTARHTFRQLLAEAGVEDFGVIKRMMGHTRNGDVDEIYYVITEKRLLTAKNKLNSYLISNLGL